MAGAGHVYIIKLDSPLGTERHKAQFYIGWAIDIEARLREHQAGRGAAMLRAAVERGIRFQIVASIAGGRELERKLKNFKDSRKALRWINKQTVLCPCCRNNLIRVADRQCWLCKGDSGESADGTSKDELDR